jgi:hypothetical protein
MLIATRVEQTLAQTIGAVASSLSYPKFIDIAARTAPVEAAHAGVLQYLSGAELFIDVSVVNDYVRPTSDLDKS